MSSRYYIMVGLIALFATGCLEERMKKAQEMVEWKTIDSVFQYMNPQPGKEKLSKGDPIAVEIKAVLGSNGTRMIIPLPCIKAACNLCMLQHRE